MLVGVRMDHWSYTVLSHSILHIKIIIADDASFLKSSCHIMLQLSLHLVIIVQEQYVWGWQPSYVLTDNNY